MEPFRTFHPSALHDGIGWRQEEVILRSEDFWELVEANSENKKKTMQNKKYYHFHP
jgi:hypothetical protein